MRQIVGAPPARRWIAGTVAGVSTLTRPSDTTAYTAGDEVSDSTTQALAHPWVFANVGRSNGGSFTVTRMRMALNDNNTFTGSLMEVWFYTATPTMVGDNAAFSHIAADDANLVGMLTLTSVHRSAVGATGVLTYANTPFLFGVCAAADTSLYAVLIPNSGVTPTSAETFALSILVEN